MMCETNLRNIALWEEVCVDISSEQSRLEQVYFAEDSVVDKTPCEDIFYAFQNIEINHLIPICFLYMQLSGHGSLQLPFFIIWEFSMKKIVVKFL